MAQIIYIHTFYTVKYNIPKLNISKRYLLTFS